MAGKRGQPLTPEHREKIAAALRGRKRPEAAEWLSRSLSGRPLSEEHKAKIAEGLAKSEKRVGRPPVPWEERFWKFVDKNGPKGCWVWTGGLSDGYGTFTPNVGGVHTARAHKWIYEQKVGPVPKGLELDHVCRVRNCVNYEGHLEPVTKKENWERSRPFRDCLYLRDAKGRWVRREVC